MFNRGGLFVFLTFHSSDHPSSIIDLEQKDLAFFAGMGPAIRYNLPKKKWEDFHLTRAKRTGEAIGAKRQH